jgi:hypothetical protein
MTVSHTWHDLSIEVVNTAENMIKKKSRRKVKGKSDTWDALLRIAILCNRAEFKPEQVDSNVNT